MKDYLQDLIQHTYGLGVIELVKVVGTDKETNVYANTENKTLIFNGKFNTPIADFIGVFGMPNLDRLKTILGFEEYDEHAIIIVLRQNKDGEDVPASIQFVTKISDFTNDYRLMAKSLVEEKIKTIKFAGATWNIEFVPTLEGIMRLKKQASANNTETNFVMKVDKGDLKCYFGDIGTHSGNFVFQPQVNGSLSRPLIWPIKVFQSIMDLPGEKTIRLSDQGVAEIVVDSGLGVYYYRLPAQTK